MDEHQDTFPAVGASRLFSLSEKPSIEAFAALCSQAATCQDYPLASSIESNVPVYDLPPYASLSPEQRSALQDEWYRILLQGPGVLLTRGLYRDDALLDRVTDVFHRIIDAEKRKAADGRGPGDHFAGAGSNDRIWNSFTKHALEDPPSFARYYANPYLGLVSRAWLGPGYRITAQVNNVRPGGQAQVCHRDYHLGFAGRELAAQYPRAAHVASQCLTLQGAVAHVDAPRATGSTRLLPFSQAFPAGYLAYRLPEFADHFLRHHVALPLRKGDGLFFNPALFHAAGANESAGAARLVNLLQVSSAFGKPMEAPDALPVVESAWAALAALHRDRGPDDDEVRALVAAVGEWYPFPTNLDRNPPRSGDMMPESEQDVILAALAEGRAKAEVLDALRRYRSNARAW